MPISHPKPAASPVGILETLLSNQEKILSNVAELKTDVGELKNQVEQNTKAINKLTNSHNSLCLFVESLQSNVNDVMLSRKSQPPSQ